MASKTDCEFIAVAENEEYRDETDFAQAPGEGRLFTTGNVPVEFENLYKNQTAFLLCSGPSLTSCDLSQLGRRGVLTLAVNHAAVVYRPHLWCCVDEAGHFCDAIWRDPGITKFVPVGRMDEYLWVRDEENFLVQSDDRVREMPAVFGYRRNEKFDPQRWFYEDSFNWGNHLSLSCEDGIKGGRSVMYVGLKLLYLLGCRRVYLLGCDFQMEEERRNYCFQQDRTPESVRSNTKIYKALNHRMRRLLPYFEEEGFEIFNCTENSGLEVFPYVRYEGAIELATSKMPKEIVTEGMYDKAARRPQD